MRDTREQEERSEPGTRQRPADASGNERLNPQGESKQARKLGETGTPQLSPRPSCALYRSLGGLHPHSHPQIPPDPQATPRAGPSKIMLQQKARNPAQSPPPHTEAHTPGAWSLSLQPSLPQGHQPDPPRNWRSSPGAGPCAAVGAGPSLSSTS